jgi:hypothetical protein
MAVEVEVATKSEVSLVDLVVKAVVALEQALPQLVTEWTDCRIPVVVVDLIVTEIRGQAPAVVVL